MHNSNNNIEKWLEKARKELFEEILKTEGLKKRTERIEYFKKKSEHKFKEKPLMLAGLLKIVEELALRSLQKDLLEKARKELFEEILKTEGLKKRTERIEYFKKESEHKFKEKPSMLEGLLKIVEELSFHSLAKEKKGLNIRADTEKMRSICTP